MRRGNRGVSAFTQTALSPGRSGGSGHALVPLLLLDDHCVERRDLHLDVVELGAAARSRRQHGQLFMVRPGVWDLFLGRVVVLHGAPKICRRLATRISRYAFSSSTSDIDR